MKSNTFFQIMMVFIFSVTFFSCSKEDSILSTKTDEVLIEVSVCKASLKTVDEDDDGGQPIVLTVKGQATTSDGTPVQAYVELVELPESYLAGQTETNEEGYFVFQSVQKGSYQLVVKQDGVVVGSTELNLE